jgi:hypothetical protein
VQVYRNTLRTIATNNSNHTHGKRDASNANRIMHNGVITECGKYAIQGYMATVDENDSRTQRTRGTGTQHTGGLVLRVRIAANVPLGWMSSDIAAGLF